MPSGLRLRVGGRGARGSLVWVNVGDSVRVRSAVRVHDPRRAVRKLVAAGRRDDGGPVRDPRRARRRSRCAGIPNDLYFQIGLLTLIGLAAKNAILIVEFAVELNRKEGMSFFDAAAEAARLRLRPIVMTSFAFVLGTVPLAHRDRRVGQQPPFDRHRRDRRHARGHRHRDLLHPDVLLAAGDHKPPVLRRQRGPEAGAGARGRARRAATGCWRGRSDRARSSAG